MVMCRGSGRILPSFQDTADTVVVRASVVFRGVWASNFWPVAWPKAYFSRSNFAGLQDVLPRGIIVAGCG